MLNCYTAEISGIELRDEIIAVDLNYNDLDKILVGLRALACNKIEKFCLLSDDRRAKAVFKSVDRANVSVGDFIENIRLDANVLEAIEGLVLDFLLEDFFPEQHVDFEVTSDSGKKYDLVIRVSTQ